MKVVAFSGSARKDGNTAILVRHVFAELEKEGIETELVQLAGERLRGCIACYQCWQTKDGSCAVKDDCINDCIQKMRAADGILLASPVYYGDVTAQLKGFVDRTFCYLKPDYPTNPQPSRLAPKKLVFVIAQGHPDEALFADIFPRYQMFLQWMGFADCHLIRACGIGPARVDAVPEPSLRQAEELARTLVA